MWRGKFDIDNRNAVITGGASGIGFALAKGLGARGCRIMIAEPSEERLSNAVAALKAARAAGAPVTILSAPGAARSGGPAWWRELGAQAGAAVPEAMAEWILDCADEAGTALAALREGVTHIALECDPAVRTRVCEIAAQTGAVLATAQRVP